MINLKLDINVAKGYNSEKQKARVITENWAVNNLYCPRCGAPIISEEKKNSPVRDFHCSNPACGQCFELKSRKSKIESCAQGGSYSEMVKRTSAIDSPDFFFLYHDGLAVSDLLYVPKQYISPDPELKIVVPRHQNQNHSIETGKREQSLIHLNKIPKCGLIYIIKDGKINNKFNVMGETEKFSRSSDSWDIDMRKCIRTINKEEFSAKEVLSYISCFQMNHPKNQWISHQIYYRLHKLCKNGDLEWIRRGVYRVVNQNYRGI